MEKLEGKFDIYSSRYGQMADNILIRKDILDACEHLKAELGELYPELKDRSDEIVEKAFSDIYNEPNWKL